MLIQMWSNEEERDSRIRWKQYKFSSQAQHLLINDAQFCAVDLGSDKSCSLFFNGSSVMQTSLTAKIIVKSLLRELEQEAIRLCICSG